MIHDTCTDRADEHRESDRVHDQAAGGDDDQAHEFVEQDHLQAASAGSPCLLLVLYRTCWAFVRIGGMSRYLDMHPIVAVFNYSIGFFGLKRTIARTMSQRRGGGGLLRDPGSGVRRNPGKYIRQGPNLDEQNEIRSWQASFFLFHERRRIA